MKRCLLVCGIFAVLSANAQYQPQEGGGFFVRIDSVTPLNTLIARLERDWQFVHTYKAYWIGYTEDMWSIAARKDAAVQALVDFCERSSNLHARVGVIYTLHLIGINSIIDGRADERFVNERARSALLYLLKYDDLQPTIVGLLTRDPNWMDVPEVFTAMERSKSDCWSLNNYLSQYPIGLPIAQPIPKCFKQEVSMPEFGGAKAESERDEWISVRLNIDTVLAKIYHAKWQNIAIDTALLAGNFTGHSLAICSVHFKPMKPMTLYIRDFLEEVTDVGFMKFGSRLQYYLEGNKLHICTQMTAKQRLIDYWRALPKIEKNKFERFRRCEFDFRTIP